MPKKARVALLPVPAKCVLIGIDPGESSGWAVLCSDGLRIQYIGSGCIEKTSVCADEVSYAVGIAAEAALDRGLHLVAMGETWTFGGPAKEKVGVRALIGLGAAWERWRAPIAAVAHSNKILRVNSRTWQAAMLKGSGARTSDALKSASMLAARSRYPQVTANSPDESDAACIATFGMHDPRVAELVSRRLIRRT